MMVICVGIHGIGLFSLDRALRQEAYAERIARITPLSLRGALFTLLIVLTIAGLHGLEIWAYALVFLGLGAVQGLEDALYFSTISYSTVGYHDTIVASQWKLLGAFESVIGLILIGWSTAFFFRMLGRIEAR